MARINPPWAEWDGLWNGGGGPWLVEAVYLFLCGAFTGYRNRRPWVFGAGRYWHGGPNWYIHLGPASVYVSGPDT